MPRYYDVTIDAVREATQQDIDRLVDAAQAFGALVTFLRQSMRMRDGGAAEIAVQQARGKITAEAARRGYERLLDSD
jgi:hypothetical protein